MEGKFKLVILAVLVFFASAQKLDKNLQKETQGHLKP